MFRLPQPVTFEHLGREFESRTGAPSADTLGTVSLHKEPYPARRPLAAAPDAKLTVVLPPEFASAADAASFVETLERAGLPVEVADEPSLSRRPVDPVSYIHMVIASREALDFLVAVAGAGAWAGIAVAFKRLTGRKKTDKADADHRISLKVDYEGRSHLVGTAVGDNETAKLVDGLPAILDALRETPGQDPA